MKLFKKLVTLLLVCTFVFTVAGCKKETAVGTWKQDESVEVKTFLPKFYPTNLEFKEDGTGSANGYADFSWEVKKDVMSINFGDTLGTYSYEYKLDGDQLYLDEHCYAKQ